MTLSTVTQRRWEPRDLPRAAHAPRTAADLAAVIDSADVAHHPRYQPGHGETYCNISRCGTGPAPSAARSRTGLARLRTGGSCRQWDRAVLRTNRSQGRLEPRRCRRGARSCRSEAGSPSWSGENPRRPRTRRDPGPCASEIRIAQGAGRVCLADAPLRARVRQQSRRFPTSTTERSSFAVYRRPAPQCKESHNLQARTCLALVAVALLTLSLSEPPSPARGRADRELAGMSTPAQAAPSNWRPRRVQGRPSSVAPCRRRDRLLALASLVIDAARGRNWAFCSARSAPPLLIALVRKFASRLACRRWSRSRQQAAAWLTNRPGRPTLLALAGRRGRCTRCCTFGSGGRGVCAGPLIDGVRIAGITAAGGYGGAAQAAVLLRPGRTAAQQVQAVAGCGRGGCQSEPGSGGRPDQRGAWAMKPAPRAGSRCSPPAPRPRASHRRPSHPGPRGRACEHRRRPAPGPLSARTWPNRRRAAGLPR
jgi:hypothetical protein